MINWFKKRRTKKEIEKFEKVLSDKLGDIFPTMKELRENSKLQFFSYSEKPIGIRLAYSMNGPYFERHGKKHRVNFKVDGLEIKRKKSIEFVKLPVTVTHNLIGTIEIDNPSDIWKDYDLTDIRVQGIKRTELEFDNEDEKKLKKILKGIDEELKRKIEVDDTFEIELDGKRYYTILDMEDGNYIGVNSRGQVYRLHHDSEEQAKLINKSITDFLTNYSGVKKDFEKLFD
jgi:hypothetical protein